MALLLAKFTIPILNQLVTNVNPSLIPSLIPAQCLSYAEELLPDLVGRLYMDTLFAKDSIDDMESFISSLRNLFHQILAENQWMDETTKRIAITKLSDISELLLFQNIPIMTQNC
jgi:hypothetical protein